MKISKEKMLEIIKFRGSCRSYDPNLKISDSDFNYILESARLAPSSIGSEPWKFLVIQNLELRKQIAPLAWGIKHDISEASHLVVILSHKGVRFDSDYVKEMLINRGLNDDQIVLAQKRYEGFQKNDIKILDEPSRLFDWSARQSYIALGFMMLAAAAIGVDSCAIEGFDYQGVEQILNKMQILDENYGIACMITFGYRMKELPQRSRKPLDEIVNWIE